MTGKVPIRADIARRRSAATATIAITSAFSRAMLTIFQLISTVTSVRASFTSRRRRRRKGRGFAKGETPFPPLQEKRSFSNQLLPCEARRDIIIRKGFLHRRAGFKCFARRRSAATTTITITSAFSRAMLTINQLITTVTSVRASFNAKYTMM